MNPTFQRRIKCWVQTTALFLLSMRAMAEDAVTGPQKVKHQIVGLFMPEREEDLRELLQERLPNFKLVQIDIANAEVTLEYDAALVWPGEKPEKYVERLDALLRQHSRNTFGAKRLRTMPLESLKRVEIPVVGLDCKGCSYAAYLMVYQLPGVECATASFKSGKVTALIDPRLTDKTKLEEALKAGGVELNDDL